MTTNRVPVRFITVGEGGHDGTPPAERGRRRRRSIIYGSVAGVLLVLMAVGIGSWWPPDPRGTGRPGGAPVRLQGRSIDLRWSSSQPSGWRGAGDGSTALSGDGIVVAGLTINQLGDGTTGKEWGLLEARGPDGAVVWSSPKHRLALTTPFWSDGERIYTVWERRERRKDWFLDRMVEPVVERLLVTVDGRSGRELWWTRLEPTMDTRLAFAPRTLLVVSIDRIRRRPRDLVALDGPTGGVLWRAALPAAELDGDCSVALVGDTVQLHGTGRELATGVDHHRYAIVDLRSGADRASG